MSAGPPRPPFGNLYSHRTAGREAACWVCGKLSTAVLTHRDIDWFHVCVNHINDRTFCQPAVKPEPPAPAIVPPPATKKTPKLTAAEKEAKAKPDGTTPAAIAAEIKQENSAAGADAKDSTTPVAAGKDKVKQEPAVPTPPTPPVAQAPAPPPQPPTGPVEYILDKKIFFMREALYRQRQQQKAARSVSAQLPSVPRSQRSQ